jgi:hypothetical protein
MMETRTEARTMTLVRIIARLLPRTYRRIVAIGWEQGRCAENKRWQMKRNRDGTFAGK